MPTPRDDLIRILDGSFFPVDLPGVAEPVPVAGTRGFATASDHFFANLVVADGLNENHADLDAAIKAVTEFFAARGNAFHWLVHVNEAPHELARRLERHGFVRAVEMAGMVLRDLAAPIPAEAGVTVRAVGRDEAKRHAGILERAFGLPPDAVTAIMDYRSNLPPDARVAAYLAFVAERSDPVGFAELVHAPGTSAVLLGGAATEAAFRGRGVYRALLARRLADARVAGADTATILAARGTSAPICARLGFEEIVATEAWMWRPPAGDDAEPA